MALFSTSQPLCPSSPLPLYLCTPAYPRVDPWRLLGALPCPLPHLIRSGQNRVKFRACADWGFCYVPDLQSEESRSDRCFCMNPCPLISHHPRTTFCLRRIWCHAYLGPPLHFPCVVKSSHLQQKKISLVHSHTFSRSASRIFSRSES